MNTINCKLVRNEIDETSVDQELSGSAARHLIACAGCRRFHEEQRALRDLVASLESVKAPADFDFRLRARLATEKDRSRITFHFNRASLATRALAAATLVLLLVVTGVLIRNRMLSGNNNESKL